MKTNLNILQKAKVNAKLINAQECLYDAYLMVTKWSNGGEDDMICAQHLFEECVSSISNFRDWIQLDSKK